MITAFIFALLATLGFGFLFHVPPRFLLLSAFVGALGWVSYQCCLAIGNGPALSCFVAACVVGFAGDIFSRIFKDAATIFIIPGILPLVPGAGMYYTMLATIEGDIEKMAETGTETLLMAGAIAAGLLVIGSLIKLCVSIKRRLSKKPVHSA